MLLFVLQVLKGKVQIINLSFCFRCGLFYSSVLKIHFSVESAEHDLEVCEFLLVCLELKLFIVGEVWLGLKGKDAGCDDLDLIDGVTDVDYGRVFQSGRRQGRL